MTALLFTLGIIVLCIVLLVYTVHHMVDTLMRLYDDVLDDRMGNYGTDKATKKYKEDTNDSDRT